MLKIGLVGCGTHAGWAVIPAIGNTNGLCKLAGAADIIPENLDKIKDKTVARFTDHRKLIGEADLDAVYIATLPDTHAAIAIDALRAGLHVICEKPMAANADECRRMINAAREADRLLVVDFETRFHPGNMRIRQWIDEGRLGRIEAIHIQHFWDGHKIFGVIGARRKRLADFAGALDCGIHKVDIIRYFCGGRWKDIRAEGRWFGEDTRYPTHISILAELDNGVMATLNASFAYTAYIKDTATCHVLTIVGTDGVVSELSDGKGSGDIQLVSSHGNEHFDADSTGHAAPITMMLSAVADAVEARAELPPQVAIGEDGLMAQVLTEQANDECVARRTGADVKRGE